MKLLQSIKKLNTAIKIFNSEDIIKYLKERGIDSIILV